MNLGRLALASVVVLVFIFVTDFLVHGLALMGMYEATADMWRPQEEMEKMRPLMMIGQLWISIMLCTFYAVGWKNHTPVGGLQFGFLLGLFNVGSLWIMYVVEPYPLNLILAWSPMRLLQPTIAGLIVGAIYKPKKPEAA